MLEYIPKYIIKELIYNFSEFSPFNLMSIHLQVDISRASINYVYFLYEECWKSSQVTRTYIFYWYIPDNNSPI